MELNLIKGKYERPAVAVLNGGNKRIEPNRNFCNKTRESFFSNAQGGSLKQRTSWIVGVQILLTRFQMNFEILS